MLIHHVTMHTAINLFILDNWVVSKFLLLWIMPLWKIWTHPLVYISPLGQSLAEGLLGHWEVSFTLTDTLNFQKVVPTAMRVPVALHPQQCRAFSTLCSFVCYPVGARGISVLICFSQFTKGVEHLFICSLINWISSLWSPCSISCPFFYSLVRFYWFIRIFVYSLWIMGITDNPFSVICVTTFVKCVANLNLSFHFLLLSFDEYS